MGKALLLAPMGSIHRRFNKVNIDALQELGYEVHLAANFSKELGTESQNEEYVEQCTQDGIVIHSIPYQRRSLFRNLLCLNDTLRIIRQEKFDIIHAHTETGGFILRLLVAIEHLNAKLIYTPHGISFYKGGTLISQLIYRPIEKWICSVMNCCIAINGEEYRTFSLWNKKTAQFICGIGLDVMRIRNVSKDRNKIRQELSIPLDSKVLLSIGELDNNKNHKTIIEALPQIKHDNLYYLICGTGPNSRNLIKIARNYGVDDRVILAGYRSDIPDIIHASDVFVFPSKHEGLPVSLMEAMAGGLPVVCSNIRGNIDLINDGENGYLADTGNLDMWIHGITSLLENDAVCANFITRSNRVIERYSYINVKKEITKMYQEVYK